MTRVFVGKKMVLAKKPRKKKKWKVSKKKKERGSIFSERSDSLSALGQAEKSNQGFSFEVNCKDEDQSYTSVIRNGV